MESQKTKFCNIRLTENELVELERLMKLSGVTNRTRFIKAALFGKPLKVIAVDKNTIEIYKILVSLQAEYKAIGNNYNQATKAIHTAFTDKKALAFVYRLREATQELIRINKDVIRVTKEFEAKWLQK